MGDKGCKENTNDWTIYGTEFTAPTEYANKFLHGRYRITLRGVKRLDFGIDWEKLPNGGFKILIPGFNATSDLAIEGEFY